MVLNFGDKSSYLLSYAYLPFFFGGGHVQCVFVFSSHFKNSLCTCPLRVHTSLPSYDSKRFRHHKYLVNERTCECFAHRWLWNNYSNHKKLELLVRIPQLFTFHFKYQWPVDSDLSPQSIDVGYKICKRDVTCITKDI